MVLTAEETAALSTSTAPPPPPPIAPQSNSQPSPTDFSNPLAMPALKDLVAAGSASNAFAEPSTISAIANSIGLLGLNRANIAKGFWDIALHCADVGSSASVTLVGRCEPLGETRAEIARVIKQHCTLRQFCMFYSRIVWNILIKEKRAPAGWMRHNYTEADRYAAFDFFSGVLNSASLQVPLIRQPTSTEILAHNTNARVSIYRTRIDQFQKATTAVEITGGTASPTPWLLLPPP
uniref:Coat protein n=1 Tax=Cnidium virus X TaxID=2510428 RepID=A0A8E7BWP3_9VIRU|nr:coat protein [Cnidium virus X]